MSQQPTTDDDISPTPERRRTLAVGDTIAHKCAGNELRCIHWASQCATAVNRSNAKEYINNQSEDGSVLDETDENVNKINAPLCTPLTCIVDVQGFRFFIMCIPPVDDSNTLVYGKLSVDSPFLSDDPNINEQIKKMCRYMHLKNHFVPDANNHPMTVSSGSDFQGHLCEDGRVYLMNLSRAAPADLPQPGTNQILTHQLRPEFVQHYAKPLTGDAYRPEMEAMEDFTENAQQTCEASLHLHRVTIPALVNSIDNLSQILLDSSSLTNFLHINGVNMRHLGKMYTAAKYPHTKSLLLVEITSRSAKHVLNQTLRSISRKARAEMMNAEARGRSKKDDFMEHNSKLRQQLHVNVLDFLNLVVGQGEESDRFWENTMLPVMKNKFDLTIQMPKKRFVAFKLSSFLLAVQFHCGIKLQDHDKYDFSSAHPISADDVVSTFDDSKVKWKSNEMVEAFSHAARANVYMEKKDWGKALHALNLSLSLHKETYNFGSYCSQVEQAGILNKIADTFYNVNEFQEAIEFAKKALPLAPAFSIENSNSHLILMKAHFKLKDHTTSGKYFTKAKKTREWIWGKNHPCVIELTTTLADLFYAEDDLESAALYVEMALEKAEVNLGLNHNLCSELSLKYGILLAYRGSSKDSIRLLKRAVEFYSKSEFADDNESMLMLGKGGFSLSEVYAQNGEFDSAMESAMNSLKVRLNLKTGASNWTISLNEKNEAVIESYEQVASIFELQGNLEESIDYFEKALSLVKKNNEGKVDVGTFVGNIARIAKKILSLEVISQPLPMRNMLKQAADNHPSLRKGTKALEDTMDYIQIILCDSSPGTYLRMLLDHVSNVDGDESELPQLPASASFSGLTPSPAGQLAALSKMAEEIVEEEEALGRGVKGNRQSTTSKGGGGGYKGSRGRGGDKKVSM